MTDILQEASELINGQRAKDYGPVTENFERIADLWTTYVGGVVPFTAFDVSNMMILVKVARIRSGSEGVGTGFHRDSYVDIAGYAALAERCWDEIDTGRAISDYIATGKTEPRVWDDLREVPFDVEVMDAQFDLWRHFDGVWHWGKPCGRWTRAATLDRRDEAPFTEVLDTEPEGSK